MSRKFQCRAVPSSWLENNGRRLDCGPYMSGAIEAKELLKKLKRKVSVLLPVATAEESITDHNLFAITSMILPMEFLFNYLYHASGGYDESADDQCKRCSLSKTKLSKS